MGGPKKLKLLQKTARPSRLASAVSSGDQIQQIYRLLDALTDPAVISDEKNLIVYVNLQATKASGFEQAELVGKPLSKFLSRTGKSRVDLTALRANDADVENRFTILLKTKSGDALEAGAETNQINFDGDRFSVTIVKPRDRDKKALDYLTSHRPAAAVPVDDSPLGYHALDIDGCLIEVNETWLDNLGYRKLDVIGRSFGEFLSPQHIKTFERDFPRLKKIGRFKNVEVDMLRKDGSSVSVSLECRVVYDEKGDFVQTHCLFQDISEQRRTEEALKSTEELYRSTIDSMADMIHVVDRDLCFTLVNSTFATWSRTFGFKTDVIGLSVFEVFPFLDDTIREQYHRVFEGGQPLISEESHALGKREVITETRKIPIFDNDRVERVVTVIRDITERKRADDAIRRERDRAQRYLDMAGTALLAVNRDERVVLINRKGCEILGCEEMEAIGANWFDCFIPVRIRETARKVFNSLMAGDEYSWQYFENSVVTSTGQERVLAWQNTLLKDAAGNITGALSSGTDITDRQHMEKVQSVLFDISEATNQATGLEDLLRTIHEILGTLIDTTNFYVALYDGQHDKYTFPYLVDQYHDDADLKPEQLKKTLTDYVRRTGEPLLADERKDAELRARGEVDVIGEPSQIWLGVPLRTSHGVIGVVAVQSYSDASLYKDSDMDLMTFVSRHISMAIERKLAEEALRESEEHYRSLVETMSEGLVVCDKNRKVTFANKRFAEMLGYTRLELLDSELLRYMDEENWKIVCERWSARSNGYTESYELQWLRSDGTKLTTIVSPEPVRDVSGDVVGSFSVITDISERKKSEDRLRQATDLLRVEREALTQKNVALKEILDHIEKERQDYKQSICSDVEQAMAPFLTRLKMTVDEDRVRDFEALETHLEAILAKDVDVFRDRYAKLTPRESEVCELIKTKMSSKEISDRLNLSLLTVHKHREQIRRKLGITSKGINLSTYLQSH